MARPWILFKDYLFLDEGKKLFGSKQPGLYVINNSKKTTDINVVSLSIKEWTEPDCNGIRIFNITIQEEIKSNHFVCYATIIVDADYKLIKEELHDKYNDCFKVGWSHCYTMIRYLAGCPDWNDLHACGLV